MVRHRVDPYSVRMELGLEPNYGSCSGGACGLTEPDWCFDRFGMSTTRMPDGRIVCIAGEHEDWYDPDFCIYNDVTVLRPAAGRDEVTPDSGEVEIYGYPESIFPPTDFHSATLVGGTIYIIGRLGYQAHRRPGQTPIVKLDAATYQVEQIEAAGPCPGWIYKHHASYDAARHAIIVRGGKLDAPGAQKRPPNLAAHRLLLADMRWEVISPRETHRRFIMAPACDLAFELGEPPAEAFRPRTVDSEWLMPEDRGVPVYRLDIGGVQVSFDVFIRKIQVFVQGDLPTSTVDALLREVKDNLGATTGAQWKVREVEAFPEFEV